MARETPIPPAHPLEFRLKLQGTQLMAELPNSWRVQGVNSWRVFLPQDENILAIPGTSLSECELDSNIVVEFVVESRISPRIL